MPKYEDLGLTVTNIYDQSGNGRHLELDGWVLEISENAQMGRLLTPDRSTELRASVVYKERLSEPQMQTVAANLLRGDYLDTPVLEIDAPKLIPANAIMVNPKDCRVIKMLKSEHADAFFANGHLRLGSIDEYRQSDDPEIGDNTEGEVILIALRAEETSFKKLVGGLNDSLFCCTFDTLDMEVMSKFEYDAAFEIVDPDAFIRAVGTTIGSVQHSYARCIYGDDKVVVGENLLSEPQNFDKVSNVLGEARAFIKPERYAHQREVRFKWSGHVAAARPLDIVCPEAVKVCKRII